MDSYSARLLPANQERDLHKQHLVRVALLESPGHSPEETWTRVISEKAGLHPVHFSRAAESGLHHDDGSHCGYCAAGLGERWMCTHCSHGIPAQQYPHLDNIVCRQHSRWAGPDTRPEDQRHVGPELHVAERQFRRLRRRGQMDAHFYITLRDTFRAHHINALEPSDDMTLTDISIFPLMMLTATALTRGSFLRSLFDPCQTYSAAYALLNDEVTSAVGDGFEDVARRLWLFLRPTFLSVREHTLGKKEYSRAWAHDFPVPDSVIRTLPHLEYPVEPFRKYLDATGDYVLTEKNWEAVRVHHLNPPKYPGTKRRADDDYASICRSGHRVALTVSQHHKFHGPSTDACRVCTNHLVEPGFNDLETRRPDIAAELHPEDNNGILASQVFPGSPTTYNWRCTKEGHRFSATAFSRTNRDSECSRCLRQAFQPGVNDILTKRPDLAVEWDSTRNALRPEEVSIGSPDSAWWRCHFDHGWEALIESRAHGHGCPKCAARNLHQAGSLTTAHPEIALEWDTAANGSRTPDDVAANSRDVHAWLCPERQHPYTQRVDCRVAGSGCPYCARRRPLPGETDFVSEHPLIAIDWDGDKNDGVLPNEILPGTTKYRWKCIQNHEQYQSIPHRVLSKGCTECPTALRSGASGDTASTK